MELVQFDIEQVIIAFDLVDLPTLAKLCTVAWENLFDNRETEALARQARTYAAAFQAMAVGGLGMANMPPSAQDALLAELAELVHEGVNPSAVVILRSASDACPGGQAREESLLRRASGFTQHN